MFLRNKQIFIVEDNPQNRVIFTMMLLKNGAQVHFERWGEGALRQLAVLHKVDLIIMDLMLANNVSGYDIADQIRALPEYAHVPIVAVSATDPSIAIPQAKAHGFKGFIAKPIDNTEFPKQILNIMKGEEIWDVGQSRRA